MTKRMEIALTEDQIIIRATNRWFAESSWSIDRFASELLVPALAAAFPPEEPKTLDTPEAYMQWKSAKGVQVGRVLRGTTQFPLAWKWIWVGLLPTEYQQQVRKELLAIAGVLDIPMPHTAASTAADSNAKSNPNKSTIGEKHSRANLARLMKEFAEMVASSAPAQDGEYNNNDDRETTVRYMTELEDVIEAASNELISVMVGTGLQTTRLVAFRTVHK